MRLSAAQNPAAGLLCTLSVPVISFPPCFLPENYTTAGFIIPETKVEKVNFSLIFLQKSKKNKCQ